MEKWQIICICDLKSFRRKEKSIKHLENQLTEIKSRCDIKAIQYDKEHTLNKNLNPSDQWLNDLVIRDELEKQLRCVRQDVNRIRKTLEMLPNDERTVLEGFFINRPCHYIEALIDNLHLERSSIYRLKDKALENYVLLVYGQTSYH